MDKFWTQFIGQQMQLPYFQQLSEFIEAEESEHLVFPKANDRLNAFKYTPYDSIKVVIVGQDPYHELNQAQGLAFSVPENFPLPPSLRNIFKELKTDCGIDHFNNGSLVGWAKQGVFLINSILTVRCGKALSHQNKGWERFYQATMETLNKREQPIIFVLWGKKAQAAKQWIDASKHVVIESNHPSPLSASRGFFGSKPFSKINEQLIVCQQKPIDWSK